MPQKSIFSNGPGLQRLLGRVEVQLEADRVQRRGALGQVGEALGVADRLVSSPETFLLPKARERNVGVIAMKVFGYGEFRSRDLALRYSLGLPGVSLAIVGLKTTDEVEEVVANAADYRPLEAQELGRLIGEVKPLVERDAEEDEEEPGRSPLFWLHDTKVMGWKQRDEPALVAY